MIQMIGVLVGLAGLWLTIEGAFRIHPGLGMLVAGLLVLALAMFVIVWTDRLDRPRQQRKFMEKYR